MSLSAASSSTIVLHAFLLLAAMVAAAAASEEHHREVNMTTFTNAASSVEGMEMYYCILCAGRHPRLIHMCPIFWDSCFLNCWVDPDPAPPAPPLPPSSSMDTVQNYDCYVMKLYMSGRSVIVQSLNCALIGHCFLTCGGGELDDQKVATALPVTIQGRFVPSEQLCNREAVVNALRAPPSSAGIVVPAAAGAH